ncbi:hypothetical protein BKA93DRAFT_821161 [Sparassis latifolia]|uniref:C2H2-type domain-containing protein n=1 Tax=Sparassis crispa TaxID=139825 RepID=A0A401G6M9_9APHY|nr:hypothetical protein SCP_0106890 [Sparassis crispa]GBE77807.1 hypothetical protein SCP_0106890 [Sparassis crispa]
MNHLPSVLPSTPALQDLTTTPDELQSQSAHAKVTNPKETAIFICALGQCNRLFPDRERLMKHRKRDHDSENQDDIITWNE